MKVSVVNCETKRETLSSSLLENDTNTETETDIEEDKQCDLNTEESYNPI